MTSNDNNKNNGKRYFGIFDFPEKAYKAMSYEEQVVVLFRHMAKVFKEALEEEAEAEETKKKDETEDKDDSSGANAQVA